MSLLLINSYSHATAGGGGGAASFVGVTHQSQSGAATRNLSLPAGIAGGDVLFLFAGTRNGSVSSPALDGSAPSFTLEQSNTVGSSSFGSSNERSYLWSATLVGDETTVSYTQGDEGTDAAMAIAVVVRDAASWVESHVFGLTSGTLTHYDDGLVVVVGLDHFTGEYTADWDNGVTTEVRTTGPNDTAYVVGHKAVSSANSSDTYSTTTSHATGYYDVLVVSLAPATAVGDFAAVAFTSFDLTAEGFADSTAIGTLTDQTGNGRDATQATGSQQPVAQTDTGMKVARFDGTNDVMQTATWTVEPQPNTVVALARFTAGLANTRFVFDGGATDRNALFNDGSTGKYSSYAGTTINGSASDTSWHVFVARFDGASSAVWIDGVQNFAGNAGTQGLTRLTIGAAMDAAGGYLNGDVNFIGLYDGDLKTDDLTLLNGLGQELADRAGITWTDIASPVDDFAAVAHTAFDLTAEGFADSTAIGTLTDQSGNGRDVTQATGSKQPVAQTVSGMKVARFDGTDDYLDIVYGATLTLPVTYVALVKSDDADTATRALMDGDDNNTTRHLFYTAAGSWTVSFGSGQTVGTDDSAWHVLVITGSGTGDERVYIDGGAAAWTGASGSEDASGLTLGATEDGDDCWDGDVNFFGVYDGDLRTDDLTLLNGLGQELADRAGITWTDIV